jgi:hypothetical protein
MATGLSAVDALHRVFGTVLHDQRDCLNRHRYGIVKHAAIGCAET